MRIVFIIAFINAITISTALCQGKLRKEYSYNSIDQMAIDSMPFKLYYIIDSTNTILYKRKKYYRLTISTDSSNFIGFIASNKRKKSIDFVSKYYKASNYDSLTNSMPVGTPLFQFRRGITTKLYYMGFLSDIIQIRSEPVERNGCAELYRMVIEYFAPIGSESIYVYDLMFTEGDVYPSYITFTDPFLGKIKCLAN